MTVFIDTSAWSLALRRDIIPGHIVAQTFRRVFETNQSVASTGLVLQELLQGFSGPKNQATIAEHFKHIDLLVPSPTDHIEAAKLRNLCRKNGVQLGTIDALIASLCLRNDFELLTADKDFPFAARHTPLRLCVQP